MLTDRIKTSSSIKEYIEQILFVLGVRQIKWSAHTVRASHSIRAVLPNNRIHFYSDEEFPRYFQILINYNSKTVVLYEPHPLRGWLREYKRYSWEPGLRAFAEWVKC